MSIEFPEFNATIRHFEADNTIEALRNPQKFVGKKVTKNDIKESARELMEHIHQHPSFKVHNFVSDSPDPEERRRTYHARSIVGDAFSGGFNGPSDMLGAYNDLVKVNEKLWEIANGAHVFVPVSSLGKKTC